MEYKQRNHKKIVLTGGPGVGKTTLVDTLAKKGHKILPEAARIVIEQELKKANSDCVPWKNVRKFQERVLELQLELESENYTGITFLDRGIIDGHAYSKLGGVQSPENIPLLARDRYHQIFLIEPLPLFENDSCRKETPEQAAAAHLAIHDAYLEFGYNPIRVPVLAPYERAEFILNRIEDVEWRHE
jgi:predicted ATPase